MDELIFLNPLGDLNCLLQAEEDAKLIIVQILRKGYKSGALKDGLTHQYIKDCEYVAIFDADFQPDPDFLLRSIPYLVHNPEIALVQARWVFGSDKRPPPPRKGEGSSGRSPLGRLQADMFMRVVDETLAQARANPDEYTLTAEEVSLLSRNVVEGDSSVPSDHPISRETRHAIIRVMVEVLNNIYKKDGPGAVKGKAPADDDDDVNDGDPDDEDTESDEDHDMSAMPHVSHGGPIIRG